MRIAVDAAGGDFAPGNIVAGALVAARHLGFDLILVGSKNILDAELTRHADVSRVDVRVVEAPDTVAMDAAGGSPETKAGRLGTPRGRNCGEG